MEAEEMRNRNKERLKRRRKKHQTRQNYVSEMIRGYMSRRGSVMRRSSKENPVRAPGDEEINGAASRLRIKRNLGNVKEVGVRGEGQMQARNKGLGYISAGVSQKLL